MSGRPVHRDKVPVVRHERKLEDRSERVVCRPRPHIGHGGQRQRRGPSIDENTDDGGSSDHSPPIGVQPEPVESQRRRHRQGEDREHRKTCGRARTPVNPGRFMSHS